MQRQLRQDGGIMDLSPVPRENFGLGSKLKRAVRKIIPNEVAQIATKAAPFVAPFNPAVAAAMAGIGSFDQTGSIGDSLKRGALTYGGGQLARFIGGAGFQGNPFQTVAKGGSGAFRGGLEGFKGGFTSPFGADTGVGKMLSDRAAAKGQALKVEGVEGVKQSTFFEDPTLLQEEGLSLGEGLGGGDSILDKGFDLIKKGGKEFFYKDGKLDKTAVIAAVSGAASYIEALALAEDAGTTITEEEYDEAKKADKKAEYAGYLENFFDSRKDGGRIGFNKGGSRVTQLFKLLEEAETAGDDDKIREIKSDLFKEFNLKLAQGGRIGFRTGTPRRRNVDTMSRNSLTKALNAMEIPETDSRDFDDEQIRELLIKFAPDLYVSGNAQGGRIGFARGTINEDSDEIEEFKQLISGDIIENEDPDMRDMDDLMSGGGISFSRQEKSFLFRKLGGSGGSERSYTMPQLYRILSNPNSPNNVNDARVLKEIAVIGLGGGRKDGGRIGFKMGTEVPVRKNKVGIEELDYRQSGGFVPVGVKEKADDVPAMLSKNEFVMTADAVRGIGGGSVDKGAEKLYNVMKQAEKVGKA